MTPAAAIGLWAGQTLYGFIPDVVRHDPKLPDELWVDQHGNPLPPQAEERLKGLDQSALAFCVVEGALSRMSDTCPRKALRRALIWMYHDQRDLKSLDIRCLPSESAEVRDAVEWARARLPSAHSEILDMIDDFLRKIEIRVKSEKTVL